MEILDCRDMQVSNVDQIFPVDVLESPWVLFHGTTNVSATHIELAGFKWDDALYDKNDVNEVVSIFQKMDWAGLRGDSYAALSAYTLGKDFSDGDTKPIFFSDFPERTINFTKQDRVGGETAQCLLNAISDLKSFFENESVRSDFRGRRYTSLLKQVAGLDVPQHFKNLIPEKTNTSDCLALANYLDQQIGRQIVFPRLQHGVSVPYEPWDMDLEWLCAKLESLHPLYDRLMSLSVNYDHGVIFAVEFNERDVPFMKDLNTGQMHGFVHYGQLSPNRIVAKALISANQNRLNPPLVSTRKLMRMKRGITGALIPTGRKEELIAKYEEMVKIANSF
jgi:hypothetical protein